MTAVSFRFSKYVNSCKSQIDVVTGGCVVFPSNFQLRQAFWFIPIRSDVADSAHLFWLENLAGQVYAVHVRGIGQENPEALISYFSGIEANTSDDQLMADLLRAWLFPPKLYVKILRDIPVNPAAVVCDEHPGCDEELVTSAQVFYENLNPKIIKVLGPDVTASAYNTVQAWSQHAFRNRLQACEKYPWIRADLEFSTVKTALPPLTTAVLNSIDFGKPFERLLAELYGVDRHTLRCVAKLSRNLSDWDALPVLLIVVDAMKPDFRLRIGKSWSDVLIILRWCQRWALEKDMVFLKQFAKEIFRDGIAGAQRIFSRELPGHNPKDPSFDLEDYLRSDQPGEMQRGTFSTNFGHAFQSRVRACGSVVAVFAESVAWHRAQSDPSAQPIVNLSWAPLFDGHQLNFGHFQARELTSAAELSLEGVSQSNCVASYAYQCAVGNDYIFSLVHTKGHQLRTTAHYENGPNGLQLVEHKAYGNDTPCASAKANAADLLNFLRNRLALK